MIFRNVLFLFFVTINQIFASEEVLSKNTQNLLYRNLSENFSSYTQPLIKDLEGMQWSCYLLSEENDTLDFTSNPYVKRGNLLPNVSIVSENEHWLRLNSFLPESLIVLYDGYLKGEYSLNNQTIFLELREDDLGNLIFKLEKSSSNTLGAFMLCPSGTQERAIGDTVLLDEPKIIINRLFEGGIGTCRVEKSKTEKQLKLFNSKELLVESEDQIDSYLFHTSLRNPERINDIKRNYYISQEHYENELLYINDEFNSVITLYTKKRIKRDVSQFVLTPLEKRFYSKFINHYLVGDCSEK